MTRVPDWPEGQGGQRIAKKACAKIAAYGHENHDDTDHERPGVDLLELPKAVRRERGAARLFVRPASDGALRPEKGCRDADAEESRVASAHALAIRRGFAERCDGFVGRGHDGA